MTEDIEEYSREHECETSDCVTIHGHSNKKEWCVKCLVAQSLAWGLAW